MKSLPLNRRVLIAWLLVLPALGLRAFTVLYPMVATFTYSFMDYNQITRTKAFIGLQNYFNILGDLNIHSSIRFTFLFTFLSILLHIVIGVALALVLNIQFKGRKFLRSVVLLPWAIPAIVAGIAAQWMFNDTYGMINDLINRLVEFKLAWLVNPFSAQFAVIIVDVWKDTPFFAVLILAGLQGIPHELYESARIDGANGFNIFWRITLPSIRHLIITLTVFFTLWRLTSFDLVYAMTQGGPGSATALMSYRVFIEAFKNLNFGYASSVAMVLFLFLVIVSLAGFFFQKKVDY